MFTVARRSLKNNGGGGGCVPAHESELRFQRICCESIEILVAKEPEMIEGVPGVSNPVSAPALLAMIL